MTSRLEALSEYWQSRGCEVVSHFHPLPPNLENASFNTEFDQFPDHPETSSHALITLRGEDGTLYTILTRENMHTPFNFPGGCPLDGETPLQTTVREVREETGIMGEPFPMGVLSYSPSVSEPGKEYCIYYLDGSEITLEDSSAPLDSEMIAVIPLSALLAEIPIVYTTSAREPGCQEYSIRA